MFQVKSNSDCYCYYGFMRGIDGRSERTALDSQQKD